jgi:hypothetical protein
MMCFAGGVLCSTVAGGGGSGSANGSGSVVLCTVTGHYDLTGHHADTSHQDMAVATGTPTDTHSFPAFNQETAAACVVSALSSSTAVLFTVLYVSLLTLPLLPPLFSCTLWFHPFLPQRIPERIIEHAVKGMLPKGRLGRDIRLHLKVYKGTEHPHEAQQPTNITSHISKKPKEVAALKQ